MLESSSEKVFVILISMLLPENVTSYPVYSVLYSLPYFFMAGFVLLTGRPFAWSRSSGYSIQRNTMHSELLILFAYTLFFGLRWYVMSDTIKYHDLLENVQLNYSWKYLNSYIGTLEPAFLILYVFCKSLGFGFHSFVFINSLIDFGLLYACVKRYSINKPLTLLLFLAFNGILIEFNLMRNVKAMYLFFFSLQYIRDNQLAKFLFTNLIGLTFHTSALLFFPMYWVLRREFSFKVVFTITMASTLVFFFNKSLLQDVIFNYVMDLDGLSKLQFHASNKVETILTLGTVERILTIILLIYMRYRACEKSQLFNMLFNIFVVYYVLFCLLGFNQTFTDRVPNLFLPVYWFIYPYIYLYYRKRIKFFHIFLLALILLKIYSGTHMCSAYYETVLFHETTVQERDILNFKVGD